MTNADKKQLARTYLQHYAMLRKHQDNRSRLLRYLSEDNGSEYSEVVSDMRKMAGTYREKHEEVVTTLGALPDTPGKTALFAHYILQTPYKSLAIDLKISDRHLNRLVDYALIELADLLIASKKE